MGEKSKTKIPEIQKTKTGKKFVKIKGKKVFLETIIKRINRSREKRNAKFLKTITKRNLKTALTEFIFKEKAKPTETVAELLETAKLKRPRKQRKGVSKKIPPLSKKTEREAKLKRDREVFEKKQEEEKKKDISEAKAEERRQINLTASQIITKRVAADSKFVPTDRLRLEANQLQIPVTGSRSNLFERLVDVGNDYALNIYNRKVRQAKNALNTGSKKNILIKRFGGDPDKINSINELFRPNPESRPKLERKLDELVDLNVFSNEEVQELGDQEIEGILDEEDDLKREIMEALQEEPLEGKEQEGDGIDLKQRLSALMESDSEQAGNGFDEEDDEFLQKGGVLVEEKDSLDNFEIDKIMAHLKTQKDFLGTFPKDHFFKAIAGIKPHSRGGTILNLDPSSKPGSHWVAVFFDGRPQGSHSIEFFDSFGRDPPKEIKDDLLRIPKQLDSDQALKLKVNGLKKQDERSVSCGFHAINFIMNRLRGKPFKSATGFKSIRKNEDQMESLKKKFDFIL